MEQVCRGVQNLDFTLLHAPDRSRKRGYPLNVGLKQCYASPSPPGFLFFLDDDDVVYPPFTQVMVDLFQATGADLVYAASNRRPGDAMPTNGFLPRHIFQLLYENFIAINSFAVRFQALRRHQPWFDEQFEYAEDWQFLVTLLETGLRFEPDPAVLSEFRTPAGEHGEVRGRPEEWNRHYRRIRRQINNSSFPIPGPSLVGLIHDTRNNHAGQAKFSSDVLAAKNRHIGRLEKRLLEIENSFSWRLSAPLRAFGSLLLKLGIPLNPRRRPR